MIISTYLPGLARIALAMLGTLFDQEPLRKLLIEGIRGNMAAKISFTSSSAFPSVLDRHLDTE